MPQGNFFTSKVKGTSQFWQGLHKVKHLFKWGAIHKVKNGSKTFFWEDVWIGDSLLKLQFPSLFCICEDSKVLVQDCFFDDSWSINFRRTLTEQEGACWEQLLQLLQEIHLEEDVDDDVSWALDSSKSFTTKSLYRFLTFRGVCLAQGENIWKIKLPLKIKIFLWQMSHDKLQSATALAHRGWKGSDKCVLCGQTETTKHIFFECSLAKFTWCCLRDIFELGGFPTSWQDLQGRWFSRKLNLPKHTSLFLFAGVAWALWNVRNKMAIEKSFPNNPLIVIRRAITFLQKWRPLLKTSDGERVNGILEKMEVWLGSYRLNSFLLSDIVEL
ncbi:unnamed protein product [Urochloa humidicola]